jgi:6-phosphogluconolactonase
MHPLSRRRLMQGSSMLALVAHPWFAALAKDLGKRSLLLVGTETAGKGISKGIYTYAFDPATGDLEQLALAAEAISPSFLALAPGNRFLYAANESGFQGGTDGGVTSFAFDAAKQSLTPINEVSSGGADPVYVSVDHTGQCVFVANYGGGSISSFHVEADGHLSDAVSFYQYHPPADDPGKLSHAHRVTLSPDNGYLLVNDLGLDMIHLYKLDAATAKLTPHAEWNAGPGDGPRALRFHPNNTVAYCVNETKPTVTVLRWNAAAGTLTKLQTISLIPEGSTTGCHPGDIVFDRQTSHAYVTTRRDNTIAIFSIAKNGTLTLKEKIDCGGTRPRDLALDPTDGWLLVADQESNNIAALKRDKKTGGLSNPRKSVSLGQPMCLIFPDRSSLA